MAYVGRYEKMMQIKDNGDICCSAVLECVASVKELWDSIQYFAVTKDRQKLNGKHGDKFSFENS